MSESKNLVFGIHAVIESIKSGKEIERVLLKRGLRSEMLAELTNLAKERSIPCQTVPPEKLDRVSRKNHQGCIAFVSPVEYQDADELITRAFESGKAPMFLFLDRITDVRNFGAICRTAECAGVDAVIVPSRGAAQLNADAVKASAGALMRIPICRSMNLKESLRYAKESGLRLIGVTEKAPGGIFETDLTGPIALILGSEEDGISPEYLKMCDITVSIPMAGHIASLNVGSAAAISLFETVRQRCAEASQ
jgi:23S rRNA (guanosine2251-2'-O)-methyltransferase